MSNACKVYKLGDSCNDVNYINPKHLKSSQIVDLENAYQQTKGNIAETAYLCGLHYFTVYRYIKKQFCDKEKGRADKGKSRALKNLSAKETKQLKETFEILLMRNCQGVVSSAIEKTEMNTGIKLPRRIADQWAAAFKSVHKRKHYPKDLLLKKGLHVIRDLWTEFENFNDCVYADEWKVDEFGVWVHYKDEDYEKTKAVTYIVGFMDAKTRKPELLLTQNSVTTADTIRAALNWVTKYGRPKQFVFENAKTWKNDQFLRFILGLYDDNNIGVEFCDYDHLLSLEITQGDIKRTRVGRPEGKPIERLFKIIKDEFCAFSESYSPNPTESRKPELNSSHPEVTKTFEELRFHLTNWLQSDFMDRERICFKNRMLSLSHDDNKSRPKTIREAFDAAYSRYNRVDVDQHRVAYLYAERYKRRLKGFQFEFIYPTSKERMIYIPDDMEKMMNYMDAEVVLLVNQYNIYKGWFYDTHRNLICGATDIRLKGVVSKDQANVLGKANSELLQITRKKIKALEKVEKARKIYTFAYEKTLPDAVELEDVKCEEKEIEAVDYADYSDIYEDESILEVNN